MTAKKLGRPELGEQREELVKITFKADAATVEALELLTRRMAGQGYKRARSLAIRQAILRALNEDKVSAEKGLTKKASRAENKK